MINNSDPSDSLAKDDNDYNVNDINDPLPISKEFFLLPIIKSSLKSQLKDPYLKTKDFNYTMVMIDNKINVLYKLCKYISNKKQENSKLINKLIAADKLLEDVKDIKETIIEGAEITNDDYDALIIISNETKILIIILLIIILVKYNELEESLNTSYQIKQKEENSNILPISDRFGMGKSTFNYILRNFINVIIIRFLAEKINFTNRFKRIGRIPNVINAIDGSHILIKASYLFSVDYFNRKGFYLIVLQAVVDHKKKFLNICVGWPVSTHDREQYNDTETGVNSEINISETSEENAIRNAICDSLWNNY
ncbi:hypothetical protein C1645_836878 [Glomus cerebriforme]|uniref:DDE Tnp4 domain-containing protein n=1 Tax=Glomus cerebriforme TaxID=658196 RepID=A0A397S9V7_9GLOM|nr:hypothetical protein C1645_836878 [Glomus cerebriforme]